MSSTPWIVGLVAAVIYFVYFEYKALQPGTRIVTLSAFIYGLGAKFPLAVYVMGFFSGALAVHFFWHWCPVGSVSMGMLTMPHYDGEILTGVGMLAHPKPN